MEGCINSNVSLAMGVTNGVAKFQHAVDKVVEVGSLEGTFPYI